MIFEVGKQRLQWKQFAGPLTDPLMWHFSDQSRSHLSSSPSSSCSFRNHCTYAQFPILLFGIIWKRSCGNRISPSFLLFSGAFFTSTTAFIIAWPFPEKAKKVFHYTDNRLVQKFYEEDKRLSNQNVQNGHPVSNKKVKPCDLAESHQHCFHTAFFLSGVVDFIEHEMVHKCCTRALDNVHVLWEILGSKLLRLH